MIQRLKSILVALTQDDDEVHSPALGYALSLAGASGAHLSVQAASVRLTLTHAFVNSYVAGLLAAENARLRNLTVAVADRARLEARLEGVTAAVHATQSDFTARVSRFLAEAAVNDISVFDAEPTAFDVDRDLLEAALFSSGRPALLVPRSWEGAELRHAVIAWDGSGVAARAVGDAMTLLRAAGQVEIVSVTGEKDLGGTLPGTDLAAHLSRHGLEATVTTLPLANGDVAETLRRHLQGTPSTLLVCGAFKHSRLRQWILGGVTRSLLADCPVPLLMSH